MVTIILIISTVCAFANAKTPADLFESYFEKTFITKKITLNEAKRLRILANAQLSGLNEESPKSRIADTHKLLMLLVELESLFPKEEKYFKSKQLLTRFYNLQLLNRSQEAEFILIDTIMKAQGPIKAIEYFNRYISSIKSIEKPIFTGFAISLKCDLLAQLYITSEYESCLNELYKISPKDSEIVQTQKLNQLKYYYLSSTLNYPKSEKLKTEILGLPTIQKNKVTQQFLQKIHDLVLLTTDPGKLEEALSVSNELKKIDLTSDPVQNFNTKKDHSILLLKLKMFEDAKKEAQAAFDLVQSSPVAARSGFIQNNALLLNLYFQVQSNSLEKNKFDLSQKYLISESPICTENILHNAQLAILLHAANYNGELFQKLRQSLNECEKYVGLKNQESYIKTIFEIAQVASQEKVDKVSFSKIEEKYKSVSHILYPINYFQLIIDELSKRLQP